MTLFKRIQDDLVLPPNVFGSLIELQQDESLWLQRKVLVEYLFGNGHHDEACELVLSAPEIPCTALDSLFVVRVLGEHRRDRAIDFINHVLTRVTGDMDACMKMAQVFCGSGHHLLSSRFYGAAQASGSGVFDIGTETASLWLDDHNVFHDFWKESGYDPSVPEQMPMEDFLGKAMSFLEYTTRITAQAIPTIQAPPKMPQAGGSRPKLLIPKSGL